MEKLKSTQEVPDDLPFLIPIGESLGRDLTESLGKDFTSNHDHDHKKQSCPTCNNAATRFKEMGNQAFNDGYFIIALEHYSKAIALNPKESVFYSNRAIVYLKLNRYQECITDCTASIDRKPSFKAYARRAAAWTALKEHSIAVDDFKRALDLESKNTDCLVELHKCLICLEHSLLLSYQSTKSDKTLKALRVVQEDLSNIWERLQKVRHGTSLPIATPPPPGVPLGTPTGQAQTQPLSSRTTSTTSGSAQHTSSNGNSSEASSSSTGSSRKRKAKSKSNNPPSVPLPVADNPRPASDTNNNNTNSPSKKKEKDKSLASASDSPTRTSQNQRQTKGSSSPPSSHEDELLNEVVSQLSKELQIDKNNSIAYMKRAEAYIQLGQIQNAIADFRSGLRMDPDNKDLQNGLKNAKARAKIAAANRT